MPKVKDATEGQPSEHKRLIVYLVYSYSANSLGIVILYFET